MIENYNALYNKAIQIKSKYETIEAQLNNREIESAIRFSLSYENTKEEVDYTIDVLKKSLMFLRRIKR